MNTKSKMFSTGGIALGIALALVGLVISPSTVVESLGSVPTDLIQQVLQGAVLFKIGLVILGVTLLVLARLLPWQMHGQPVQSRSRSNDNPTFFILTALLLAASALRLYSLNSGLWHDEILAYVLYAKLPLGQIISTYDSENQHILYSLFAHISLTVFGDNSWALRLPAAVFGVGSIGALYLLGRQVTSRREALLATALLTFSYHHIWFSQNARGYSALLFFTLLASWLLVRALEERRPDLWLWFALATALGVYAHLTMMFVTLGHFAVYVTALWSRRKQIWPNRWTGLFWGFGLAGLLTFQLYALVLPQVLHGLNETSEVAEWKQPLWTLLELLKGLELSFAGGLVAVAALAVGAVGLWSYLRTSPALVQMLIMPPLLGAAVVIGAGHHLWPRFFFFAFGFAALVAMRGAVAMSEWVARRMALPSTRAALVGLAAGAALVLVSAKSIPYVYAPKQDFAGALAFVEASQQPGDAIVTVGLASFTYQNLYKLNWEEIKTVGELNSVRASAKRTWLVYTLAPEAEAAYPDVMQSVQRDFKVIKDFYGSVGDGDIYVCMAETPVDGPATSLAIPSVAGQ
jgi:mannosyltransferase